jgi:hypothetical protein
MNIAMHMCERFKRGKLLIHNLILRDPTFMELITQL